MTAQLACAFPFSILIRQGPENGPHTLTPWLCAGTAFGSLLTAVNGAEQCASSPNLIENSGAIVNSILIAAQAEGSPYNYAEAPAAALSEPQAMSAEGAPEEGPVTVGTAYTLPSRGQYASRLVASPEAAPASAPTSTSG